MTRESGGTGDGGRETGKSAKTMMTEVHERASATIILLEGMARLSEGGAQPPNRKRS